ncbi:Glycine betaine/carnitine/choline transport ATP-binding protein OpuCA [Corynebacterium provencense]|uniref:ABC-type quaternary amine transporter n=1 Tax=Corynebacterium provencense TaxID=1737425 RepID=A0A2Z3YRG4_9CORY|nr:ATP-binding cassette domain-containing protein [Corynebacterium provencense]AWT26879.1 Glycine betaine/carnitine/choline transport ATP-binding protein OpuCA [Corynebacterium provencense]
MIELRNVSKKYPDGTVAVTDLTLSAPNGRITALVGPSGCGKTTTLRMVNRLIEPSSGEILLDGESVKSRDVVELRRHIGYVIQNAGLLPHRTVIDNIETVPRLEKKNIDKAALRERARSLMDMVGLDSSFEDKYPGQLSGGQSQRVGVARALAADPPFMLMDEPFSAVDPVVRKQLQTEFLKIQAKVAKTIIIVTHDIDEALLLADQVVVLGEKAKIEQIGTPEELLNAPANGFVRNFLGKGRDYRALAFGSSAGLVLDPLPVTHPGGEIRTGDVLDAATLDWAVTVGTDNLQACLDATLAAPAGRAVAVDPSGRVAGSFDSGAVTAAARAQE